MNVAEDQFFLTSRTCSWLQKNWHETAANLHDKISSLQKLPSCVETSNASVQCHISTPSSTSNTLLVINELFHINFTTLVLHRLRLMLYYETTTTTWLPSSESRYWTWQKYLSSWRHWSASISMSRGLLLCRYLIMIRTSQHWIPKQSHLWWVSIAAPLSRLTKKQPHPVKNPLSLSVPSRVHSVKSTKKACRPCLLPRWLQQDHLCSLLTRTSPISVTQPRSNGCAANQSN